MKRFASILWLALAIALPAHAELFSFTYQGDLNNATGVVQAQDLGNGQFLATSGTLNVSTGEMIGTFDLIPGGPVSFLSPTGTFLVDNVIEPNSASVFTYGGLLFGAFNQEINIYSVAPGQFKFDFFNGNYNSIDPGTGTVALTAAVPEPSSTALVLAGAAIMLGLMRRKRSR
jgi:hypothetical protein